jgi:hypothetical protein
MKKRKISLANLQGLLSRAEMKNIMAGSDGGDFVCQSSGCGGSCQLYCGTGQLATGYCNESSHGVCHCLVAC